MRRAFASSISINRGWTSIRTAATKQHLHAADSAVAKEAAGNPGLSAQSSSSPSSSLSGGNVRWSTLVNDFQLKAKEAPVAVLEKDAYGLLKLSSQERGGAETIQLFHMLKRSNASFLLLDHYEFVIGLCSEGKDAVGALLLLKDAVQRGFDISEPLVMSTAKIVWEGGDTGSKQAFEKFLVEQGLHKEPKILAVQCRAAIKSGGVKEAVSLLSRIPTEQRPIDLVEAAILACNNNRRAHQLETLWKMYRQEKTGDIRIINLFLIQCIELGQLEMVKALEEWISSKSLVANADTYATRLRRELQHENFPRARKIHRKMTQTGMMQTANSVAESIYYLARTGQIETAESIYSGIDSKKISRNDVRIKSALAYARALSDRDGVNTLIDEVSAASQGLEELESIYSGALEGYATRGDSERSRELLRNHERLNLPKSKRFYLSELRARSAAGEVEMCQKLIAEMKRQYKTPRSTTGSFIVAAHCARGNFRSAERVFQGVGFTLEASEAILRYKSAHAPFAEAEEWFWKMRERNSLHLQERHYAYLLQALTSLDGENIGKSDQIAESAQPSFDVEDESIEPLLPIEQMIIEDEPSSSPETKEEARISEADPKSSGDAKGGYSSKLIKYLDKIQKRWGDVSTVSHLAMIRGYAKSGRPDKIMEIIDMELDNKAKVEALGTNGDAVRGVEEGENSSPGYELGRERQPWLSVVPESFCLLLEACQNSKGRHSLHSALQFIKERMDTTSLQTMRPVLHWLRKSGAGLKLVEKFIKGMAESGIPIDESTLLEVLLCCIKQRNVGALNRLLSSTEYEELFLPSLDARIQMLTAMAEHGLHVQLVQIANAMKTTAPNADATPEAARDLECLFVAQCLSDDYFAADESRNALIDMHKKLDIAELQLASTCEWTKLLVRHSRFEEALNVLHSEKDSGSSREFTLCKTVIEEVEMANGNKMLRTSNVFTAATAKEALWSMRILHETQLKKLEEAEQLVLKAQKDNVKIHVSVFNAILAHLTESVAQSSLRAGELDFELAIRLHKVMKETDVVGNDETFHLLLGAYSHGMRSPAKLLFTSSIENKMKKANIKPDGDIVAKIIRAYGHLGALDQAEQVYVNHHKKISDVGIRNAMMHILNKAERFDDAWVVFEKLVPSPDGKKPAVAANEESLIEGLECLVGMKKHPAMLEGKVEEWKQQRLPMTTRVHGKVVEVLGVLGSKSAAFDHTFKVLFNENLEDLDDLFKASLYAVMGDPDLEDRLIRQFTVRYPRRDWKFLTESSSEDTSTARQ